MSDPDPAPRRRTVAVVLAAGAGTRFDGAGHKLAADLDGEPVAVHAIRAAVDAAIGPVVVVSGATTPPLPAGRSADDSGTPPIQVVHNPRWAEGQSTSLRAAVDAATALGADAIVVGLADQPAVTAAAWQRVAATTDRPIAVATYDGRRRNPVRLARSVWPLLPADGDTGARILLRTRPDLVAEVPCDGSPDDIDTLEDLRAWQSRSSTNSR